MANTTAPVHRKSQTFIRRDIATGILITGLSAWQFDLSCLKINLDSEITMRTMIFWNRFHREANGRRMLTPKSSVRPVRISLIRKRHWTRKATGCIWFSKLVQQRSWSKHKFARKALITSDTKRMPTIVFLGQRSVPISASFPTRTSVDANRSTSRSGWLPWMQAAKDFTPTLFGSPAAVRALYQSQANE